MSWEAILSILLPVIIYVILEKKKGLQVAVKASLVMATILVCYFILRYDFYDKLLWLEYLLLLGLGITTLKLNNARFFKFQPVIVNGILGSYVLIVHVLEGPIMLRYLPLMEKMVDDPQILAMMQSERMTQVMATCSWLFGVVLLLNAVVVAVAATRWSTVKWMWARLSVYPALAVVSLLAGYIS